MSLNEIMRKSNPARIEREMKNSEYLKLVDRNTELVDELNYYKSKIDEAIEYIKESCYSYDYDTYANMFSSEVKELMNILEGSYIKWLD